VVVPVPSGDGRISNNPYQTHRVPVRRNTTKAVRGQARAWMIAFIVSAAVLVVAFSLRWPWPFAAIGGAVLLVSTAQWHRCLGWLDRDSRNRPRWFFIS